MRTVKHYPILTSKAATGVGNSIDVRDYKNIVISLGTSGNANMTIKCKGSIGEVNTGPNFAESSKAINNQWEYIQMIDLADGTAYNGSVGIAFTGTDNVRMFAVNTDNISYLTLDVTARAAGTVTATACGSSD